ncbi:CMD domain-containing protein [Enterobacillus tribolii]|uniref:Putative peroxidase-related enzyme n=1 Tax=Enterobacillus tribolii TaxID=1487935 RepID=A0A370R3D8_9GAMM|nr:peroxidase [Enterobacillus tribolii]RDK96952.1 putative peroxidase-related enzyme [Enterobacillus tribolii]
MERLVFPHVTSSTPPVHGNDTAGFRYGIFSSHPASYGLLLQERQPFFHAIERCYRQLLDDEPLLSRERTLSRYDRLSVALTVAQVTQLQPLCSFYATRLAPLDYPHNSREGNNRLTQLTQHARLLAWNPGRAGVQDISALRQAKLTLHDIVTLSQIVGFVSLQARMIAATVALAQHAFAPAPDDLPTPQISPPEQEKTAVWRPFLPLAPTADCRPLPVCGAPQSLAYALMLLEMHQADAAAESRLLFSEGFNCNDRLRQPLRELAFLIGARANHCPHSAHHHLTRYLLLSKHRDQAEAIYRDPLAAMEHCARRDHAIINATLTLARTPARFSPELITALRQAELSDAESLELIVAVATAAWTQRLLVSLGE